MRALSKSELALGLALCLIATPADACHIFKHWAFPFPQRCGVQVRPMRAAASIPSRGAPQARPPSFIVPDMTFVSETPGISKELWEGMKRHRALLQLVNGGGM